VVRPVDVGFFAKSFAAAGICKAGDWGHALSSTSPSSVTVIPSTVPSLCRENFAQFGKVICCCCCTKLSGSFCDVGDHGSGSFWPKVKLE
jgi:hypothetical protein